MPICFIAFSLCLVQRLCLATTKKERSGTAREAADALVAELDAAYPKSRLTEMVRYRAGRLIRLRPLPGTVILQDTMSTAFIICGALAREVLAIVKKYGWDVDVVGVPAIDHVFPERIAPDVEKRILELRNQYERLIVVYGDCGSSGALDDMLSKYGIERLAGPHCYDWYAGDEFQSLIEEEPGTYFLTDFMIRTFEGLIKKSMGLDRFPQLREDYFRNYKRVVYLAQIEDEALLQKAQNVADYLELPLEVRVTGYNRVETQLVNLMTRQPSASACGS